MLTRRAERLLSYSPEQLFDLAADVERYPKFLHWWKAARIKRRDGDVYYTDQDVMTEISFDADSSKLEALGFVPRYNLEYGLREMLARWRGF